MPAHAQRVSSLLASDKEDAPCQVERGACDAGRGVRGREAGEGGSGPTHKWRARPATGGFWGQGTSAAAERTWNMNSMLVALDVMKLSGWSKAVASCRVESRACDAGREVCGPEGGF